MPTWYAIVSDLLKKHAGLDYAKFTSDEQECISRKISKLRDEGKEEDQAVAIAISTCAPEKAKSSNMSAYTHGSMELPGGRYSADQNPDGTWNVRNVPVYPVHKRDIPTGYDTETGKIKNRVFRVNTPWLSKTLQYHRYKRDKEGFLYPLHVNHHAYCGGSPGELVRGVGFIMPTKVAPHLLEGKMVDTLFFDFIGVKEKMFELIDRRELPYCSAEILDLNTNIVHSISLMEHHVPYFTWPLITIGRKTSYSAGVKTAAQAGFVQAMSAAVSYSKGGYRMPEDEKDTMPPEKEKKEKEASQEVTAPETTETPETPGGDKLDQVLAGQAKIVELLSKLLGGDEEETVPPEQGEGPVQIPSSEAGMKRLQKAEAKADLAMSKAEALEKDSELKAKVRVWGKELAAYNLGNIEEKLYRKAKDEGEPAALAYVEAVKEHGQQMPPSGGVPGTDGLPTGKYPKEVMAYQEKGPEALAAAQRAYDDFEDAKSHNLTGGLSREEFIRHNMELKIEEGR